MERRRFLISLGLAVALHVLILLVLQLVVKLESHRVPEYSGPLFVRIEAVPVLVETVLEPARPVRVEPLPSAEAEPAPSAAPEPALPGVAPAEDRAITPERSEPGFTPPEDETAVPAGEPRIPPLDAQEEFPPGPPGPEPAAPEAEEPEEPLLIPLDKLDRALEQSGENGAGRERPGPAAPTEGSVEGTEAAEEAESGDFLIKWDDPAEGREATGTPLPSIPEWVSRQGQHLRVEVSFILTPQGILSGLITEKSSGYSDVDSAVLGALRRWKFKPVNSTRNVRGMVTFIISPS